MIFPTTTLRLPLSGVARFESHLKRGPTIGLNMLITPGVSAGRRSPRAGRGEVKAWLREEQNLPGSDRAAAKPPARVLFALFDIQLEMHEISLVRERGSPGEADVVKRQHEILFEGEEPIRKPLELALVGPGVVQDEIEGSRRSWVCQAELPR